MVEYWLLELVQLSVADFDRHMKELEATYDKTFTSLSYNVIAYLPK